MHKYVVVLGSCCTADAIRPKGMEDIRDSKLRLLSYQGRTSPLSILGAPLEPHEFAYTKERESVAEGDWGFSMIEQELGKRHPGSLAEVISMADGLLMDMVSAFAFPYLVAGDRCFLRSKEWERYVNLRIPGEQKWLWEFPIELSNSALQAVLGRLYERQPCLRVIFHLPRPCFNNGVTFEYSELTANVDYYREYGEHLFCETSRKFPRVSAITCGNERADPCHYNCPFPFHYDENYLTSLRLEIERLLE